MDNGVLGILISSKDFNEYIKLKRKNTPMKKLREYGRKRCPVCKYIVDNAVPTQNYCDRCGQRLKN